MATSNSIISPGVCYGMKGTGFPQPKEFLGICRDYEIIRIRLYEPNTPLLEELNNHDKPIDVIMGVPSDEVQSFADYTKASGWVNDNITVPDYVNVRFKCITVGEVNPDTTSGADLVNAMKNVKQALDKAIPGNQIKVSTVLDAEKALAFNYLPSKCRFQRGHKKILNEVLPLLMRWDAPLLVNVHPFRFYKAHKSPPPRDTHNDNEDDQNLDYALFKSTSVVVVDPAGGKPLNYKNNFDAILDAVYWAIEEMEGVCPVKNLKIIVSESGWPTSGDAVASINNAKFYNNTLISHVRASGTPKKPENAIETYILAIFDENQMPGADFEKNWGIFEVPVPKPNNIPQPKYSIVFNP